MMVAAVIVGSGVALHLALAQQPAIGRTELTHRDLGDAIREVIQTRVDFAAGAAFPMHSHPGVEVAYVLEGSLQYQFGTEPPVTLKAGAQQASRASRWTRSTEPGYEASRFLGDAASRRDRGAGPRMRRE